MSKLEVDKIDPQSGTDLELGTSGDTITVPTGVTLDASNATTTLPSNIVTTDGSQTLTNKTINASQLTGTITPSDGTVTNAKIVDSTIALAKLSATGTKDSTTFLRGDNTFSTLPASGITEADMFRLTASLASNADPISSNLERVDDATFSKIGTGMTLSSGIYTFPSTGLYYITMNARINHSSGDTVVLDMQVSSDSGSSYDSTGIIAYYQTANDELGSNSAFVNVTNASTFRVKFVASSITSATINGSTTNNQTSFTFIRLGDSQ